MPSVKKTLPLAALRLAAFKRLRDDLGNRFSVYDREPARVTRYVAITEIEAEDLRIKNAAAFRCDLTVVVHSEGPRGPKEVEDLLVAIAESLTRDYLTIPGFNAFELDIEFATSGRESTGVYRGVALFSTEIDHE
jgi:hypothetical protein